MMCSEQNTSLHGGDGHFHLEFVFPKKKVGTAVGAVCFLGIFMTIQASEVGIGVTNDNRIITG